MCGFKNILVATDLSARSSAAIARAAFLARQGGGKLTILHVLRPRKAGVVRLPLTRRRPLEAEARAQEDLSRLSSQFGDIDVRTVLTNGAPEADVARIVQEQQIDLVVVGLHKPRAVLDTLRPTTMERITLAVPCPVLIARTAAPDCYRKVLGAITFAPASAQALAAAAIMAPDAELHAIHALELPLRDKLGGAEIENGKAMTAAELLREAFLQMDAVPTHLHLPEIIPGAVHDVLRFRIAELQPDLLVVGSHSGRDPQNLGNYARDLMRMPPTDMLVAKP